LPQNPIFCLLEIH